MNAQSTVAYTATGHTDDHAAHVGARMAFAISKLGRLVDNLVKCRKHIICKLDLCHWLPALCSHTDGCTDEGLLVDGRVEDAVISKLVPESQRASKYTTKGDIFPKAEDLLVRIKGDAQSVVDGLAEVHALRRAICRQTRRFTEGLSGVMKQRRIAKIDGPVQSSSRHCS